MCLKRTLKKENSMTLEADSNILLTTFRLESSFPCQRGPASALCLAAGTAVPSPPRPTGRTAFFSIHLSGHKPPSVPESGGPGRRWSWLGARRRERGASEDQTRGSTGPGLWKNHQGDSSALNRRSQKRATEPNHTCRMVIYDGSGHPRFETTFLPHPGHVLTRPQNV